MRTVADIMTPDPRCIDATASIREAHKIMAAQSMHHLPVVDQGRLVGLVSERDLLRLEAAFDVDQKKDPVRVAMTSPAYWVLPETPLSVVAGQMKDRNIGSAVVVSDGRVVGIFTTTDALQALAGSLPMAS
ncbi:MAG TPA: CBS domain-containing protein [Myxococcales bacterium]|nr:CBS domain-containing protein [Myxococcales bacterium]